VTLTPCSDRSAAAWITTSDRPWSQLVGFGPERFATYARVRFLPDPAFEGQAESDAMPHGDLSETTQLGLVVTLLSDHTRTADDAYFAWWDGWGTDVAGFSPARLEGSICHLPNRSYFLIRGSLIDFDRWSGRPDNIGEPGPAFIWPSDHAWCIANDVDLHWAGIGAASTAIDMLSGDLRLDVTLADPETSQPTYE
jgi:hypothetical protein